METPVTVVLPQLQAARAGQHKVQIPIMLVIHPDDSVGANPGQSRRLRDIVEETGLIPRDPLEQRHAGAGDDQNVVAGVNLVVKRSAFRNNVIKVARDARLDTGHVGQLGPPRTTHPRAGR